MERPGREHVEKRFRRHGVVNAITFQNVDFPAGEKGIVLLELRSVSRGIGFDESFESGRMHAETAKGGKNRVMPEIGGFIMRDKGGKGVNTVENSEEIRKKSVRRETPSGNTRTVGGV